MKEFSADFFKKLIQALNSTTAADGAGRAKELHSAVDAAYQLIAEAARKGKKVIMVGNGGSAGIASHIAVDIWKNGGVKAIAFNDSSLLTCIANDYGYQHVFEEPIKMFAEAGDVLIAISSSGKSENILRAVSAAKAKGCAAITMSGFKADNPLFKTGDVNFFVPSPGYGQVETAHAALCHVLVDCVIENKNRVKA